MGKRPSKSYRKLQLAYTRTEYIKKLQSVPEGLKKSTFGNSSKLDFPAKVKLVALIDGQVSARALVSIRVAIHRELRVIGEKNYRLQLVAYPFHQSRSHGLVGVAKAERISSGMGKRSFGTPEMRMAQIKKGHSLFEIAVNDDAVALGIIRKALHIALCKLPLKWQIQLEGFSESTQRAHPVLPKRVKEKTKGGQQTAELQRELKT